MDRRGIPKHLVDVRSVYKDTDIMVRTVVVPLNKEVINRGIRQGCNLSPTLFNIYLDDAVREWKQTML